MSSVPGGQPPKLTAYCPNLIRFVRPSYRSLFPIPFFSRVGVPFTRWQSSSSNCRSIYEPHVFVFETDVETIRSREPNPMPYSDFRFIAFF